MPIEYHAYLTPLARSLRNRQTQAEQILWNQLRNRKFFDYKFMRQRPIVSYVADFYCDQLKLVVEIDGGIHEIRKEYDEARTRDLQGMRITVVRYSNEQIQTELPRVLTHLKKVIDVLSKLPSQHERGRG
jgi:very-short-patch-repair endonuclease